MAQSEDSDIIKWMGANLREHFWKNKSHIIVDKQGFEWGPHSSLKKCVMEAIEYDRILKKRA